MAETQAQEKLSSMQVKCTGKHLADLNEVRNLLWERHDRKIPSLTEASRVSAAFTYHYLNSQRAKGTLAGAIAGLRKIAAAKF